MVRIAIDAMGGDHAPQAILEGVALAAAKHPQVTYLCYGDQAAMESALPQKTENIHFIHTSEKIYSEDEPVKAVRNKKDSSLVQAARAVKDGQADALFSAGNTGAVLTAGVLIIGRMKGVERPGLMPILPVLGQENRQWIMMDVGANADCKPHMLHQFGQLGSAYAAYVLGIQNPRVGLLNNGTEDNKGNELAKEAFLLLKEDQKLNFVGNVEAREILTGAADVVVTDGFTGNAVLKTIEGTALGMMGLLKSSIMDQGLKGKVGGLLLKDSFRNLKNTLDYSQFGGAVLFGLKAPLVKSHGSSDKNSVYHAMEQIQQIVQSKVVEKLQDAINCD